MNDITIYDIASKLGLSASTVSRGLNGDDRISAATREKVINTAGKLGYRANSHARQLRTRVQKLITIETQQLAIIYQVEINLLLKRQLQILIWVIIPARHLTVKLEDCLPIHNLPTKYGFFHNGAEIDLSAMLNRDCLIKQDSKGYRFVSYC